MSFSRTSSGLIAEYLFHKEPLIWVEGPTDIPFYNAILQNCRLKSANGRTECEKLADALVQNDYPYIVVLDGDYEILERTRSKHRRVILLQRHSFENYLFEKELIEQCCRNYASSGDKEELVGDDFKIAIEHTESKLTELVILDVAHQRSHTGLKVLPDKVEALLTKSNRTIDFLDSQIKKYYTEASKNIDKQSVDDAKALVEKFVDKKRFVDLLPGHLAFSILARLIIGTVNRKVKNRKKINIPNDSMRILLSVEVWKWVNTPDHNSLKRRLRRAVREAQQLRSPQ